MAKNGYTTLNLPTALVEELKVWRLAFNNAYGKIVSYGEMIRSMIDSLENSDPGVVNELNAILNKHPELMDKLANYRSLCGQELEEKETDTRRSRARTAGAIPHPRQDT